MSNAWTIETLLEGTGYSSSCTLLMSPQHRVVVDTGLLVQEDELVAALHRHSLDPADIDVVINTHLHIDHCGNNAVFPHAAIFLSLAEWRWTHAFYAALFGSRTPERVVPEFYPELASYGLKTRIVRNVARLARLFWRPNLLGADQQFHWLETSELPAGIEVLATPGHTPHHISLRIAAPAPVIIAGDAVLTDDVEANVHTMIPYSRAQFLETRQALLDRGERIVPGHGPAFAPGPVSTHPVQ